MDKKIITFGDIEIEKQKFHSRKSSLSINNVDIKKILVSSEASFVKKGFKYFIRYKNNEKVVSLCVMPPN